MSAERPTDASDWAEVVAVRCLVATGEAADLWECECAECSRLQREADDDG